MTSNSAVCVVAVVLVFSLTSAQLIREYGVCLTPNFERARCIHLEQCTFLNNLKAQKWLNDDNLLFLKRSQCGDKNGNSLVCCPDRFIDSQVTDASDRAVRGILPEPGVCGNVNTDRIVGGRATKIDEYPWMALIEYDLGFNEVGHNCGGSLINDRYVLTAAHCVKGIPESWTPVRVRLGEWDTLNDPDCQTDVHGYRNCADPHVDVAIEKIIVHPNFKASSKHQLSDIALIRLAHSISYTDYIQPICLPIKSCLRGAKFEGIVMDVAGWGTTEAGKARNIKLKTSVPVIPLEYCQEVYSKYGLNILSSQVCAGNQTKIGSCTGDSGGPLVAVDASNKFEVYFFIAGIVSYGPTSCGLQGWPGVYTKVGEYIDWIQQSIEP